ncbi:MAG: type II toxin-antitoxin system RelE/ParE family toxin [Chloroflexi bacterium]|nr:type II toxin-antitoxin system RelE/ParE family toxin [Chloroflexota bacterium]
MEIEYTPTFERDLRRARNSELRARVERLIESIKAAPSLLEVSGVVRLAGTGAFYRIRVGDYRLGIAVEDDTVILIRLLHRRDAYRRFP